MLNLTGYIEGAHPHTLGMVAAASNAIEQMLKIKEINRVLTITKKHMDTMFHSMPTGIITCDIDGNILLLNKKMVDLCGYKYNTLKAMKMEELVADWDYIKNILRSGKDVFNEDVYIYIKDSKIQVF